MKIDYLPRALKALEDAPAKVRKAFFKQVSFLEQNLHHPSLRAKKYDESSDIWQARVNKDRCILGQRLRRLKSFKGIGIVRPISASSGATSVNYF